MAKKSVNSKARPGTRKPWTKAEVSELKAHSKAKTPIAKISKAMKRTSGAVRQKRSQACPALARLRPQSYRGLTFQTTVK
jgi:hypothetical protein